MYVSPFSEMCWSLGQWCDVAVDCLYRIGAFSCGSVCQVVLLFGDVRRSYQVRYWIILPRPEPGEPHRVGLADYRASNCIARHGVSTGGQTDGQQ